MRMPADGRLVRRPAVLCADEHGRFGEAARRGLPLLAVHADKREALLAVPVRRGFRSVRGVILMLAVQLLAQRVASGGMRMPRAFLLIAGQTARKAVTILRMDVRGLFFQAADQLFGLFIARFAVRMAVVFLQPADQPAAFGIAFGAMGMARAFLQAAHVIHDVGIAGVGMRMAGVFLPPAYQHAAFDKAVVGVPVSASGFLQAADRLALIVVTPFVMAVNVFAGRVSADDLPVGVQAGVAVLMRSEGSRVLAPRDDPGRFLRQLTYELPGIAGVRVRVLFLSADQKPLFVLRGYGDAQADERDQSGQQRGDMALSVPTDVPLVVVTHCFPLIPVRIV